MWTDLAPAAYALAGVVLFIDSDDILEKGSGCVCKSLKSNIYRYQIYALIDKVRRLKTIAALNLLNRGNRNWSNK